MCESEQSDMLWRVCGRQLPLAGIAPEGAHGPERVGGVDPGGLGGFLRLGLHVGVDLRGRGRQLGACHGADVFLLLLAEPDQNRILVSLVELVELVSLVELQEGGGRASPCLPHHTERSSIRSAPPS